VDHEQPDTRLSQITTLWSVVCRAHEGSAQTVAAAQEQLVQRYGKAVYRYLLGAVRDPDTADELYQEFALRFLRGQLQGADPQRGRFRNFVRGVLFHLIADHHRRLRVRPQALPAAGREPEALSQAAADPEREFLDSWRAELLARAWRALEQAQGQAGPPFHAVLRCRAEHPDQSSSEMAELLAGQLGKPVTAAWVRKTLERARHKFADVLLDEVLQTLDSPTTGDLEQELADVGLLAYCQPALVRRGRDD
jgi:RNA polymerase sigma-70 factor (ECF subfamily)